MPVSLAAIVIPVRADAAGLPNELRSAMTGAVRQAEPAVREGAQKHGTLFGRVFGDSTSAGLKDHLGKAVSGVGGQFTQMAGVATGALGVTTAGIGALVGAAAVMGVQTAASMEQAQIGFATLLGSGQKAQTFLSQLQTFAAATPFELPGLIDSSRLLLGVGVSAKDTMTILQSFGNASSAVGVGQENFQRIMLATSQAIGAGRFMTEDLNQITENGIPIWTILSRAMGKPVPVLRQLASQGKLLSGDVLPVLERQMNRDYGGAMERQSRSLSGVWSTFMDTLNIGLANVIRPLIPAIEVGLTGATAVLTAVLSGIPSLFSGAGASGSGFGTIIRNLAGWVTGSLVPAFQAVAARVFPAVRTAIASVGSAFRDHQEIIRGVGVVFQGLGLLLTRVLIPAFGLVLSTVIATIGPAARIILSLIGGVVNAVNGIAGLVAGVASVGQRIVGSLASGLTASPIGRAIGQIVTAITSPFAGGARMLLATGGQIVAGLVSGLAPTGALSAAANAVKAAVLVPFANADTALAGAGAGYVHGLAQGMGAATPVAARQAAATQVSIRAALAAPSVSPITAGLAFGTAYSSGLTRGLLNAIGGARQFVITLTRTFSGLPSSSLSTGVRFGANLAVGLSYPIRTVATAARSLVTTITAPFRTAQVFLLAPGVRVVTGLLVGVRSQFRAVGGVLNTMRTQIISAFAPAPSWLIASGVRIVTGLLAGIRNTSPQVLGYITSTLIRAYIRGPFAGAPGWLIQNGVRIIVGLVNGLRAPLNQVSSAISSGVNRIRGAWGGHATWLLTIGAQIIRGLYSGITSGLGNVGGWVSSHITTPIINAVRHFFGINSPSTVMAGVGSNLISGLIQGLARSNPVQFIGKIFGGMPQALGAIVNKGLISITSLPGKALNALGGLAGKIGGLVGGLFSGGGGGSTAYGRGVSQWSTVVLQALAMLGQPASWLGTVLNRMQRESGGNPRAINLTDINAQHGDPSKGLMQTISGTFNAFAGPLVGRGIYDPLANVYAGLNYALHRYGSLAALSRPGGYDAGGWLPPGGVGVNLTGRPERVLDPQQSEAYARGGGAGNVRVTVMMDGSVLDDRVHVIVEDAVGELGARIDNGMGG